MLPQLKGRLDTLRMYYLLPEKAPVASLWTLEQRTVACAAVAICAALLCNNLSCVQNSIDCV